MKFVDMVAYVAPAANVVANVAHGCWRGCLRGCKCGARVLTWMLTWLYIWLAEADVDADVAANVDSGIWCGCWRGCCLQLFLQLLLGSTATSPQRSCNYIATSLDAFLIVVRLFCNSKIFVCDLFASAVQLDYNSCCISIHSTSLQLCYNFSATRTRLFCNSILHG